MRRMVHLLLTLVPREMSSWVSHVLFHVVRSSGGSTLDDFWHNKLVACFDQLCCVCVLCVCVCVVCWYAPVAMESACLIVVVSIHLAACLKIMCCEHLRDR